MLGKTHQRYRLCWAAIATNFTIGPAAPLNWWQDERASSRRAIWKATVPGWAWRVRALRVVTNFPRFCRRLRIFRRRAARWSALLTGATSQKEFLDDLRRRTALLGIHLLVGDRARLLTFPIAARRPLSLKRGFRGVANHLLDTPGQTTTDCGKFIELMRQPEVSTDACLPWLKRSHPGADAELPHTGLPLAWERAVSAPFVVDERYGTPQFFGAAGGTHRPHVLYETSLRRERAQVGASRFEFKSPTSRSVVHAEGPNRTLADEPTSDFVRRRSNRGVQQHAAQTVLADWPCLQPVYPRLLMRMTGESKSASTAHRRDQGNARPS